MPWHADVYGRWLGTGRHKRRRPKRWIRDRVLERQGNQCAYCGAVFGGLTLSRGGITVKVQIAWDHFIPYVHNPIQPDDNWVASCHICNGIKSCAVFDTIVEAKDYIMARRWRRDKTDRRSGSRL